MSPSPPGLRPTIFGLVSMGLSEGTKQVLGPSGIDRLVGQLTLHVMTELDRVHTETVEDFHARNDLRFP